MYPDIIGHYPSGANELQTPLIDTPIPSAPPAFFWDTEALRRDEIRKDLEVLAKLKKQKYSVLADASETGALHLVQYLVKDLGVSSNMTVDGWTPLHKAAFHNQDVIASFLLRSGALVNTKLESRLLYLRKRVQIFLDGARPLHLAVAKGNLKMMTLLLSHKAGLETLTNKKYTPLHIAVCCGHIEAVQWLIDSDAHVNVIGDRELRPIHSAVSLGDLDLVKLLCENGANIDVKGGQKLTTPLHIAATNGYFEIVKYLLERGAKVDVRDNQNETPLASAIVSGSTDVVNCLFHYQADPNIKLTNGCTPLHKATEKGSLEIIGMFLSSGAYVNAVNDFCVSPLHYAAVRGDEDIIRCLLAQGADPFLKTKEMKTAHDVATTNKKNGVARILDDHMNKNPKKRGFFRG